MSLLERVGNRLRERREQLGLSQADVAQVVGVTQSDVSRTEHGGSNLTLTTLRRYCKVLKLKVQLVGKAHGKRGGKHANSSD